MTSPTIIDSHVHIYPDRLEQAANRFIPAQAPALLEQVETLRGRARSVWKPLSKTFHRLQPLTRYLPDAARLGIDQVGGMAALPSLLLESTAEDLIQAMDKAGIAKALTIAHPPVAPNEHIMDQARHHPRLIPVVYIPKTTPRPAGALKKLVRQGAKALKIHPAADGEGADSFVYRRLLRAADELGLPVIIHTGCLHLFPIYRKPAEGNADRFHKWFETYKNVIFVLAHMNFHKPNVAMDLAEEYPNIYLETSWQPSEVIGEAVRRVGAERVMYGSDWPLLGSNIDVGIHRVRDCHKHGLLKQPDVDLILGTNAERVFSLAEMPAPKPAEPDTKEEPTQDAPASE